MTTKTQERVAQVLDKLKAFAMNDEQDAETLAADLQEFLDELLGYDFFGTEGQNDPRGDCRDGEWNMGHVQGIDA